ncbi:hypothetical protein BDV59DRAFT_177747 [Aspergillus ambiguus]|uniref:uncharacterized protein n=1 Tax=Aspergillus ambiguus TaxID=176160 RepID=UPI003CCDFC54
MGDGAHEYHRSINLLNTIDGEITVASIHATLVDIANQPASNLYYIPVRIAGDKPSITLRPLSRVPRGIATLERTGRLVDSNIKVSL